MLPGVWGEILRADFIMWQKTQFFILAFLLLALAACAETELAVHTMKGMSSDPPDRQGTYKVGNPYQIAGIWYYPAIDYDYNETGVASWYGPGFHGRLTANGEVYDQHRLTAAHRTLPLPSIVQVTNLENGRSIRLRVNDRGPFAKNRIIDVSAKAAELLGFRNKGTAKVRVEVLPEESRRVANLALRGETDADLDVPAVPREPVAVASLNADGTTTLQRNGSLSPAAMQAARLPAIQAPPLESPTVTHRPVERSDLFVQVGAFARKHNAVRLKARLSGLGPSTIEEVQLGSATLFRVRMGPLQDVAAADRMLEVLNDNGFSDAQIVVQ